MTYRELAKRLRKRFREAEGQQLKDLYRPNEEKKHWLTTYCTHCGYKIQFIPTEEYRGRLKCPDCGTFFNVPEEDEKKSKGPTLDDFSELRGKKEDEDSR